MKKETKSTVPAELRTLAVQAVKHKAKIDDANFKKKELRETLVRLQEALEERRAEERRIAEEARRREEEAARLEEERLRAEAESLRRYGHESDGECAARGDGRMVDPETDPRKSWRGSGITLRQYRGRRDSPRRAFLRAKRGFLGGRRVNRL